ncbi:hypothetical protein TraAM80_06536, partial [Trypanosoma rangeli]
EQNEQRRREMEGRLAELGAERDALAERVRDLGKQLDGANALLYDAARACDALGGAVGLSAPEGDGEVDGAHVADRLQRVSGVVQEQAEQNEQRRREMEGRLAELGAERDALAERVRDLGKQLDGANALLYDAARACDALGGAVGLSAPEGDGEVDGAHVADRLQRVSGVVQ